LDLSDFLRWLTVAGSGIAAGSQIVMAVVIAPRVARLPSDLAYRMHDSLLHHGAHNLVAPLPSIVSFLSAVALLIIDGVDDAAGVLTAVGIAFLMGVTLATVKGAIPVNEELRRSLADSGERDYASFGRRWRVAHMIRVLCGVAAFFTLAAAAVAY
jgi:uncharacterized membrane protein